MWVVGQYNNNKIIFPCLRIYRYVYKIQVTYAKGAGPFKRFYLKFDVVNKLWFDYRLPFSVSFNSCVCVHNDLYLCASVDIWSWIILRLLGKFVHFDMKELWHAFQLNDCCFISLSSFNWTTKKQFQISNFDFNAHTAIISLWSCPSIAKTNYLNHLLFD